jgi:hypothetical protein
MNCHRILGGLTSVKHHIPSNKNSTTSFLTATILIYAIGAGITAAAGTRLALQWILGNLFVFPSFQSRRITPSLIFFVTTSLCQDWVIYAPAAILRCSSCFSGSFSGIKPQFPVTRKCHGRPIPYRRKLIG